LRRYLPFTSEYRASIPPVKIKRYLPICFLLIPDKGKAPSSRYSPAKRPKKFRKGEGMGVRGKGRGKALFKGFPSPLSPAAGGH
jgi:hypothetical protein